MEELKKDVAITLILLEQEFPPSLFGMMIHLLIHLLEELAMCDSNTFMMDLPIERLCLE
jgi:hypothetical protein